MLARIIHIITGIIVILAGFIIIETGWDKRYGFQVPRGGGILLIVFGIILIAFSFFKKSALVNNHFVICPKCEKTFYSREIPDSKCPKCQVELEDLKGFYNRIFASTRNL